MVTEARRKIFLRVERQVDQSEVPDDDVAALEAELIRLMGEVDLVGLDLVGVHLAEAIEQLRKLRQA